MDPAKPMQGASPSFLVVMATASNFSAISLLVSSIFLLVCLDVLYYIHSLASAPRKFLFFSLRRRSTTVQFAILGLALAITLHKSVSNLIVHYESLVGCVRATYYVFAQFAPVIGCLLFSIWVVVLAIAPVLKWYPAMRRMLRSGPDASAEKHVPFASWSYEESLVLRALESRRRQQRPQHFNEKEPSTIEDGVTSPISEGDFHHATEPEQVLRENVESRSICALIGLNGLWLLLAAIEWYRATREVFLPTFINIQVVNFSFLSLYYWFDCLITWGEALVEAKRARIYA